MPDRLISVTNARFLISQHVVYNHNITNLDESQMATFSI